MAKALNQFTGIGNVGKPVELRHTQSGKAVATFSIAIQRDYKNAQGENDTDWVNIVAWNKGNYKLAEYCMQNLRSGSKVCVVGKLQTRSYDAKDGSKRYVSEIIADNAIFLEKSEGKPQGQANESSDNSQMQEINLDFPF